MNVPPSVVGAPTTDRVARASASMIERRRGLTLDVPAQRSRFERRGAHARRKTDLLPRTELFDIPLAAVTYEHVVKLVNRALASSAATLTIDALNTMGISQGCLEPRMREALLGYDVIVPDGTPLVWCMNAKGAGLEDRV